MSVGAIVVITLTTLILIALFESGRMLLKAIAGNVFAGLLKGAHLVLAMLQLIGMNVLIAHGQVLKNLLPRQSVLPSVRTKSVRKT